MTEDGALKDAIGRFRRAEESLIDLAQRAELLTSAADQLRSAREEVTKSAAAFATAIAQFSQFASVVAELVTTARASFSDLEQRLDGVRDALAGVTQAHRESAEAFLERVGALDEGLQTQLRDADRRASASATEIQLAVERLRSEALQARQRNTEDHERTRSTVSELQAKHDNAAADTQRHFQVLKRIAIVMLAAETIVLALAIAILVR